MSRVDWATPVRIVLMVGIVGAAIGVLAHLIRLPRRLLDPAATSRPDTAGRDR